MQQISGSIFSRTICRELKKVIYCIQRFSTTEKFYISVQKVFSFYETELYN